MTSVSSFRALLTPRDFLEFYRRERFSDRRVGGLSSQGQDWIDQCAREAWTWDQTARALESHGEYWMTYTHLVYDRAQELKGAGLPAKGSPEWERIARDYSPEEWEAKEAARKRAHDTAMNEALVQCIVLATEFAKLRDQEMAPYLVERPDPHRWRNLTAFVGRRKLQRVKEMAEDLHWAQVDREDYLSHMRDE